MQNLGYNLYAKAMTVYGKFQLEYMSFFMENLYESDRVSKQEFLSTYLENNPIVQDISKVSLSEEQSLILSQSANTITDFMTQAAGSNIQS